MIGAAFSLRERGEKGEEVTTEGVRKAASLLKVPGRTNTGGRRRARGGTASRGAFTEDEQAGQQAPTATPRKAVNEK